MPDITGPPSPLAPAHSKKGQVRPPLCPLEELDQRVFKGLMPYSVAGVGNAS